MFSLCLFDKMVFACQTGPELTMELTQSSKSLCTYPSVPRAGITGSAYSWLLHYHCVSFLMAQRWAGCITFLLVYRIFQNWEINWCMRILNQAQAENLNTWCHCVLPGSPWQFLLRDYPFLALQVVLTPSLLSLVSRPIPATSAAGDFSPGEDSPLSESMLC